MSGVAPDSAGGVNGSEWSYIRLSRRVNGSEWSYIRLSRRVAGKQWSRAGDAGPSAEPSANLLNVLGGSRQASAVALDAAKGSTEPVEFRRTFPKGWRSQFTENELVVTLADARRVSAPLECFPRLLSATSAQRANWRLIGRGVGIHWDDVDEDISVRRLLADPRSSAAESTATPMEKPPGGKLRRLFCFWR